MNLHAFCNGISKQAREEIKRDPDGDLFRYITESIQGSQYYFKPLKTREILTDSGVSIENIENLPEFFFQLAYKSIMENLERN